MPHPAEATRTIVPPAPDVEPMSPVMREAVRLAYLDVAAGVAEDPPGSNRGPFVDAYLLGHERTSSLLCFLRYKGEPCERCEDKPGPSTECRGSPWCARAARWWIVEAARRLNVANPLAGGGSLASAYKWRAWATKAGRWSTEARPGRVGVLLGGKSIGHVCLVARVACLDDGGHVLSVDGNVGDRVACARRPTSAFAGFVEVG